MTEKDLLPVGRVLLVEGRASPFPNPNRASASYSGVPGADPPSIMNAVEMAAYYLVIPIAIVSAPVVAVARLNDDGPAEVAQKQGDHEIFRHTIRLKGSDRDVVKDEYWRFEIGDCVAVRSTPAMLVPALPGACD